VIFSKKISLYEFIHTQEIRSSVKTITSFIPSYTKLVILTHVAKILNTFHSSKFL